MIIYWETLEKSAIESITVPDYISAPYFGGVQRIRSLSAYPSNPDYGAVIYRSDFKRLISFFEDLGWSNVREWVWRMILEEVWSADRCTGGTVTASAENVPDEAKEKAFDDDYSTKWLAWLDPTPWIVYQFPDSNQYKIQKYTLTTGNDEPTRDPKNWTFEGSNNGSDWDVLDTRTNEYFGPRLHKREFCFRNDVAYEYYRLNISANWGDIMCQLTEIEMMEFDS
jgi:hypothetical protein